MTVKSIARSAAELMAADDITSVLDGDPEIAAADDDVKILVKAVNTAVFNAANDGFPVVKTETATAVNGRIALDAFTRTPSIVRAAEKDGRYCAFAFDSRGITVKRDGEYSVTYTVEPETAELDAHVEIGAGCDFSMLAFLTARNYCLATGRADDARVFDQMYDSVAAGKRICRRAALPKREWR